MVPAGYATALQLDPVEKTPSFTHSPGRARCPFGTLGCVLAMDASRLVGALPSPSPRPLSLPRRNRLQLSWCSDQAQGVIGTPAQAHRPFRSNALDKLEIYPLGYLVGARGRLALGIRSGSHAGTTRPAAAY
jgi:hypothetical protein